MFIKVVVLCTVTVLARAGVIRYGAPVAAAPGLRYGPAAFAAPGFSGFAAPAYASPYAAPAVKVASAFASPAIKVTSPIIEAPQPYDFGYSLQTEDGGSANRQEVGDAYNNKQGSYGYTGPDGVYRQVDYIADAGGFRATIRTNEPGTANQNPADVSIAADPAPVIHAPYVRASPVIKTAHPGSVFRAPVHAAQAFRAPIVHASPLIKSHHGFPY